MMALGSGDEHNVNITPGRSWQSTYHDAGQVLVAAVTQFLPAVPEEGTAGDKTSPESQEVGDGAVGAPAVTAGGVGATPNAGRKGTVTLLRARGEQNKFGAVFALGGLS